MRHPDPHQGLATHTPACAARQSDFEELAELTLVAAPTRLVNLLTELPTLDLADHAAQRAIVAVPLLRQSTRRESRRQCADGPLARADAGLSRRLDDR